MVETVNPLSRAMKRLTSAITHNSKLRKTARTINEDLLNIQEIESFGNSGARLLDQLLNEITVSAKVDSRVTPQAFVIRLKRDQFNKLKKDDPILIIEAFKQGEFGRFYDIKEYGKDTYIISTKEL